jgi:hypothetical protein
MCPQCTNPCTSTMYINIIQCAKRYHPWNVSTTCLYQHVNMCIYQYANPCASTNMPTKCHLPTCQTSFISLMICLHQILHKTCVNQTTSRCLYQCTRSVPIIDQVMTPQHDHLINSPTTCPNMYPSIFQKHVSSFSTSKLPIKIHYMTKVP